MIISQLNGVEPDAPLEQIASEETDQESSLPTYEILTYPADYTLEVLVDKWKKKQIEIPNFQRGFVWTQVQASKLVESFLLGLPVPTIFLYSDPETNSLLVVDGQQRLKTIVYYFEGFFGEEVGGTRPVFRLRGLHEDSPFANKTYADLKELDEAAYARLNDSVLRSFVIKQLNPNDRTSIYHVFERLNTGGTQLTPQEIRNCIRHGPLNDLLVSLNQDADWREIFGRSQPDKRQRDIELILRFLALLNWADRYKKPMKNFLNNFMDEFRNPDEEKLAKFAAVFTETAHAIQINLGPRPFHILAGLNAAVFDAVFTTVARNIHQLPADLGDRYSQLKLDPEFLRCVRSGTTDNEVVANRLDIAAATLVG